jgi:hypothetical protein
MRSLLAHFVDHQPFQQFIGLVVGERSHVNQRMILIDTKSLQELRRHWQSAQILRDCKLRWPAFGNGNRHGNFSSGKATTD